MLYVACAKTAELLQLQADSLRLIRRWKIPVAVDRLLAVPGGAHLAGITFDPPRLSVWELAHPRKTAKVVLAGSRATSIAVLNARFLVIGEQTASGSGLLEVVDLADMEKILTAPVSFLVGAIASE